MVYIFFIGQKCAKRLHSLVLNITRKCHCQPTLMISRSLWPMKSTACCDILDTLLNVVLCQINTFCHHLTQIMTADFVRFTSFASFEAQNNVCKSSSIWQIQLSYFGLNGDKICWSDKEKPVKAQKTMRQSRNNIKANTFPKIRKTIWKWNDFI